MKKHVKKMIIMPIAIALCLCMLNVRAADAQDITNIKGNNTKETAYKYGKWSLINSNDALIVLESEKEESWVQFTLSPGEHIYLRSNYRDQYAGEWFEIQDDAGIQQGNPQYTPKNVYNANSINSCLYLNCDNDSDSTRNYYLVLHRGSVDKNKNICFSLSANNRIKKSSTSVSIPGIAANRGNMSLDFAGVDSSEISVDLTNNTKIPDKAIVTRITSYGTQSPRQGGVHHMIMPEDKGIWYTANVSDADSGSYYINVDDNIFVKQKWRFKYNATAMAGSTMKDVRLSIDFKYDLKDTGYKTIIG